MNPYVKMAIAGSLFLLGALSSWYFTSDHYQKVIAENQVAVDKAYQKQLEENQKLAAENAALRKSAEEEHASNQLVINDLSHQLSRVHIHIPNCSQVPGTSVPGQGEDGKTWILSGKADAAFEELQRGDDEDFARCDQLNIDAIRLNASLK
ncbi:MAG TPA: hypothetical protein VIY48_17065 [Candidatus Paceibacterota bacterium]